MIIFDFYKIHKYSFLDTTMEEAKRRILFKIAKNGDLIVSDYQSLSRGRRGKIWISYRGNIHASLLLTSQSNINKAELSLIIRNSVAKLLSFGPFNSLLKLKWPNDIYIRKHKIGGFVIENFSSINYNDKEWSIVGLGININNSPENLCNSTNLNKHSLICNIKYKNLLFKWLDYFLEHYKRYKICK